MEGDIKYRYTEVRHDTDEYNARLLSHCKELVIAHKSFGEVFSAKLEIRGPIRRLLRYEELA